MEHFDTTTELDEMLECLEYRRPAEVPAFFAEKTEYRLEQRRQARRQLVACCVLLPVFVLLLGVNVYAISTRTAVSAPAEHGPSPVAVVIGGTPALNY